MKKNDYLVIKLSEFFNIEYNLCAGIIYNLVAGFIIAPYISYIGYKKKEKMLFNLGIFLIFVELYMFLLIYFNTNDIISECLSKILKIKYNDMFKFLYCFIPAFVISPYLFYKGLNYKNYVLLLIALAIFMVDNYHFQILEPKESY